MGVGVRLVVVVVLRLEPDVVVGLVVIDAPIELGGVVVNNKRNGELYDSVVQKKFV